MTATRNGPSTSLRIAAWQGHCLDGDVEGNLCSARRAIQIAAERRADFLCLPETFLSGYGSREIVERGALSLTDPRLKALGVEAAENHLVLLAGLSERLPDGRLGNTVAIFSDGDLLGVYRKTMRTQSDSEEMGFCLDTDLPVFEARGLRFGCIICHDSSFVEPALTLAYRGARLIFSPHYNSIPAARVDEHRVRTRSNHSGLATLLGLYVVRANVVGVGHGGPDQLGYGDSVILDANGTVLAEAGLFRDGLILADIPVDGGAGSRGANRDELPRSVREQLARELMAL